MAHSATLAELVGALVDSLSGSQSSAREGKQCKEQALRSIRGHQHARINQFEVDKTFDGLLEKFEILDREDLARALDDRLKRLKAIPSKWTPEILALLLQLSDKPLEKTVITEFNRLSVPEVAVKLTWSDIIAEDPLDEEGVWDDINYAAHGSSDEDSFETEDEDSTEHTLPTSILDEASVDIARSYIVPSDSTALEGVKKSQQRLRAALAADTTDDGAAEDSPTELMIIRESVMILRGLQSLLFSTDPITGRYLVRSKTTLVGSSSTCVWSVLGRLADVATTAQSLRLWTSLPQTIPLLQTLQTLVLERLHDFSSRLTAIELEYIRPGAKAVVSLASMSRRVEDDFVSLIELYDLITQLKAQAPIYQCLELLYKRLCLAQMADEFKVFKDLGKVFFRCLETYLRPVRSWMEEGILSPEDSNFLVVDSSSNGALNSDWHDRFAVKTSADGDLDAPSFLKPSCGRILKAGKSVRLMEELGNKHNPPHETVAIPNLTLETVYGTNDALLLPPFAEMLSVALNGWVDSHYTYSSAIVRSKLVDDFGLMHSLDAVEHLYFASDGSLLRTLVDSISEKLNGGSRLWRDRFVLTDLMQDIFGAVAAIDKDKISVAVSQSKKTSSKLQKLGCIKPTYQLHWSINHIIRPHCLPICQKLFTLKMQLRYLELSLQTAFLTSAPISAPETSSRISNALRFRLTRFVTTMQSYISETVIQAQTTNLRVKLDQTLDIDEMAVVYDDYTRRLETQALLSKNVSTIMAALMQVLELCTTFCDSQSLQRQKDGTAMQAKRSHRRRRSTLPSASVVSESEDQGAPLTGSNSEQEEYDADVEGGLAVAPKLRGSYSERIRQMARDFDKLNGFIVNGLRGVSKAGGEPCYEILAEMLN